MSEEQLIWHNSDSKGAHLDFEGDVIIWTSRHHSVDLTKEEAIDLAKAILELFTDETEGA